MKKLKITPIGLLLTTLIVVAVVYLARAIAMNNRAEGSLNPNVLTAVVTAPVQASGQTTPVVTPTEIPAVSLGKYTVGQQVKLSQKIQNANVRSTTSISVVKGTVQGGAYVGTIQRVVNYDKTFGLPTAGYYALLSGIPGNGEGWIYADFLVKA